MELPSTQGPHEEHAHDSSCTTNSPKSPVDTFSWERSAVKPPTPNIIFSEEDVQGETSMNTYRRKSYNDARGPAKKPQRVFTARVSMAGKQARRYANDDDNIFSIVEEEEKPRMAKLERIPRSHIQLETTTSTTATTTANKPSMRRPRHSLPNLPSNTTSLLQKEVRISQFDVSNTSVFRRSAAGRQSQLSPTRTGREARFGRQRELSPPLTKKNNLVSERRKVFSSPTNKSPTAVIKPPRRLDSWLPPPPLGQKSQPGTPSTVCSGDEWSFASWTDTPAAESKKSLIP
ncbi:unnamed protein product [Cylindrotheca closterium]|uniref:Uncharacterized protein n=1 Tax=Cylindrotheca closterium TaxID=2856 RepID=A0AAD2FU58_9STRA|nr:unnamed protein product [Cylindrotheca closterium]